MNGISPTAFFPQFPCLSLPCSPFPNTFYWTRNSLLPLCLLLRFEIISFSSSLSLNLLTLQEKRCHQRYSFQIFQSVHKSPPKMFRFPESSYRIFSSQLSSYSFFFSLKSERDYGPIYSLVNARVTYSIPGAA